MKDFLSHFDKYADKNTILTIIFLVLAVFVVCLIYVMICSALSYDLRTKPKQSPTIRKTFVIAGILCALLIGGMAIAELMIKYEENIVRAYEDIADENTIFIGGDDGNTYCYYDIE